MILSTDLLKVNSWFSKTKKEKQALWLKSKAHLTHCELVRRLNQAFSLSIWICFLICVNVLYQLLGRLKIHLLLFSPLSLQGECPRMTSSVSANPVLWLLQPLKSHAYCCSHRALPLHIYHWRCSFHFIDILASLI